MNQPTQDGILFTDTIEDYDSVQDADRVVHILCTSGKMSFAFHNARYDIATGDYVILPNASLASGFSTSEDFNAVIMSLSEDFITSMAIRSNYGIIGHLALLQNPVIRLQPDDFTKCCEDLKRLRERSEKGGHRFHEEMLGHLLMAHMLDLYDILARGKRPHQVPERSTQLLRRFIELLYNGEYILHKDLPYYATQLSITPHYLSEICKKVSGKPATYWIDHFTLHEITHLLLQRELSLTEIAERLHFSSLSYFSRYVQKQIGISPSAYRNSHQHPC